MHYAVAFVWTVGIGNFILGNWERALLFVLEAIVLTLVDDGVQLRRRVAELEDTVRQTTGDGRET